MFGMMLEFKFMKDQVEKRNVDLLLDKAGFV